MLGTVRDMLSFRGRTVCEVRPQRQPHASSQNMVAWVVAGAAAYVLWVRPEQQARQRREVR